jgi:ferredoxin-type protein NapH
MKKRQKIRHGIILSGFFLLPALYYYLSPYLIIEATGKRIINGSFIIFLLLFLASFVFGRAYCGWVCPAAGCQEAISKVRNRRIVKGNWIKWIIWIPWISEIVMLAVKSHGYNKIDFFYQTVYGLSISDVYSLLTYIFVLLLIVLPAFIVGKRSFCHHICWMAPFMIIGRKVRNIFNWASLRLTANKGRCVHCHTCTSNCPMSLPVEQMVGSGNMENSECILCGSCIDGCEKNVINYCFKAIAR